ncbi:LytTR family transcriptional regulator DNA-binding domain-containing protein [Lactobacillus sp. ESL0684]|uniref:LytR/AlgR family response regulator transcription factor n=1 Tax=unclassified Lactobacillus TaxID=2620435 RepID=UPI0023F7CB04|nr:MULTISPECIES: LytTR family transcriptional regulator DNA-binding domain-containing protein [unclassified Lactobacillus]WEV40036.1 LytTR family transcriptional regulator DNA-binding domain-containing protein [Lactobacillus sp. ESL0681]WEV43424.1 LytTR family transcriptional regulator DNA-binding domain-containing protein [Lactobacillus sp. ESL0684]
MNILLVDDEPLARTELKYLIEKSAVLATESLAIYQAEDLKEAQSQLLKNKIDLIFLDISLNEENGFELTNELKQLNYSPIIIFSTAYDEYAVKAFDVGALDYVLKPFEQERIDQALTKVKKVLSQEVPAASSINDLLTIELDDRNVVIKLSDIVSATISDGVLTVSTAKKQYQTRKTLSWLKQRLPKPKFMQVHRNTLVNLEEVKEVQPWFNHTLLLVMDNGEKVQVGRSYRADLSKQLGMG